MQENFKSDNLNDINIKINKKSKIFKRTLTRSAKLDTVNNKLIQFDKKNNNKK